jgi:hypothetical protein
LRTQSEEFAEEKRRTKVEAFETLEILPSLGRKSVQAQESIAVVGSVEEEDLDH